MKTEPHAVLTCEIVEDLMPGYIEGVTGEATNTAIRAHLAGCPCCQAKLDALRAPLAGQPPAPSAGDQAGVAFLKKTKARARRKILLSVLAVVLLCVGFLYIFFFWQHPFHPQTGNIYRLSDGRIYFEFVVTGRESTVDSVRFFTGFDDLDAKKYQIQVSYAWSDMKFFEPAAGSKTYAFIRDVNDGGDIEAIHVTSGKTDLLVWQKGDAPPPAPAEVEANSWSGNVPFITYVTPAE